MKVSIAVFGTNLNHDPRQWVDAVENTSHLAPEGCHVRVIVEDDIGARYLAGSVEGEAPAPAAHTRETRG